MRTPTGLERSDFCASSRRSCSSAYGGFGRLATFRRKIDVFGGTVNGFGRAKTAGLPAVFFEGLW
jgi:hypothetical protein